MKIQKNDKELFEKIGNIFPTPLSDGIISRLVTNCASLANAISEIDGYDAHSLDMMYYSRSCEKKLSVLSEYVLNEFNLQENNGYYTIEDTGILVMVNAIVSRYLKKWLELIDTYKVEFNPIKPFTMSSRDSLLRDHLESASKVSNESDGEDNTNNDYYGFNSDTPSPVDKQQNTTHNENERTEEYSRDNTRERKVVREGNIGNRSNQELMKQQREYLNWVFYDVMFRDIDTVLASPKW